MSIVREVDYVKELLKHLNVDCTGGVKQYDIK